MSAGAGDEMDVVTWQPGTVRDESGTLRTGSIARTRADLRRLLKPGSHVEHLHRAFVAPFHNHVGRCNGGISSRIPLPLGTTPPPHRRSVTSREASPLTLVSLPNWLDLLLRLHNSLGHSKSLNSQQRSASRRGRVSSIDHQLGS